MVQSATLSSGELRFNRVELAALRRTYDRRRWSQRNADLIIRRVCITARDYRYDELRLPSHRDRRRPTRLKISMSTDIEDNGL